MSPGVLRQVMPCLSARPERGSTKPAYPDGIATASPVGTSARPPPAASSTASRAWRSYPASSVCCCFGSGSPWSSRWTRISTASVREVAGELGPLRIVELHPHLVRRMVDDQPGRARRELGALLGVEREAQVVHRRRDVVTGEALLVARHRLDA